MSNYVSDIDFVMIWVDGNDPEWQRSKSLYRGDEDKHNINNTRYRDWDLLHYWFRGVEKYAPWVRKIHFVTCGHVPAWLKLEHPKLHFVKHEDYMDAEFLPTFSSHPIELNLHRIDGLADKFVYFNDDTFLSAPVSEEDFFVDGLPRGYGVLNPPTAARNGIGCIVMNNLGIIADHFDFWTQFKSHITKWINPIYGTKLVRTFLLLPWRRYLGFLDLHLPTSFLKSTFEEVWKEEEPLLRKVCRNRFRSDSDVNQWLMCYWQIATGRFAPASPKIGKVYYVTDDVSEIVQVIKGQKLKMICVNDSEEIQDIAVLRDQVAEAFEYVLPEKCSFEK